MRMELCVLPMFFVLCVICVSFMCLLFASMNSVIAVSYDKCVLASETDLF